MHLTRSRALRCSLAHFCTRRSFMFSQFRRSKLRKTISRNSVHSLGCASSHHSPMPSNWPNSCSRQCVQLFDCDSCFHLHASPILGWDSRSRHCMVRIVASCGGLGSFRGAPEMVLRYRAWSESELVLNLLAKTCTEQLNMYDAWRISGSCFHCPEDGS